MLIFAPHNQLFLYPGPCSVLSTSLWPHRLLGPQDCSGKNTGVGLPFPSPRDLPDPGIEPKSLTSPALQAHSLSPNYQGGLPMENSLHLFKDITKFLPNHLSCSLLYPQQQVGSGIGVLSKYLLNWKIMIPVCFFLLLLQITTQHTLINKPIYLHVPRESSGRTVNTVNYVYPWGMSNFNFPWLWSTEPTSW